MMHTESQKLQKNTGQIKLKYVLFLLCMLVACEAKVSSSIPVVGDKIILPASRNVWNSTDVLYYTVTKEGFKGGRVDDVDGRINTPKPVGFVGKGAYIKIWEVGPDYAGIEIIKPTSASSRKAHGYVRRWW